MNKKEQVLLYGFENNERTEKIKKIFNKLSIKYTFLKEDSIVEKIGYLLGNKGFAKTKSEGEFFQFPHEVMLFSSIMGKRLDDVLLALKNEEIKIPYKAVVTPFNKLWTLERLVKTMEKEHGAMIGKE